MENSHTLTHRMIVLAFPDDQGAFEAQKAFKKLSRESLLELREAVVVTRNVAGKVKLHQSEGVSTSLTSAGTVLGLIVGVVFMVPGVGSAVGAGVGAAVGAALDLGLDDDFLKEIGQTIQPGTSALFLLGNNVQLDKVGERLGSLLKGCTLLKTNVNVEREAEVRKMLDSL